MPQGQMTLHPRIIRRITELGGEHGTINLDFEPAVRAIRLPPLIHQSHLDAPMQDFTEHQCQQAEDLLKNTETRTEEFVSLLQTVFKITYIRTFEGKYFRPFAAGEGWGDLVAPEAYFRTIVRGDKMEFVEFAFIDGVYPDLYYICLTDENPSDPTLYATDHASSWMEGEIYNKGTLSNWLSELRTLRDAADELARGINKDR